MTDDISPLEGFALDLINSYDPYFEDPEALRTPGDLEELWRRHGIDHGPEAWTEADLTQARQLRDRLWAAFEGRHQADGPSRLNELAAGLTATPLLGPAFELAWRPAEAAGQTPADRLRAHAVLGLATALSRFGPDRLKSCAAAPCRFVFVDTLRNRSRRFCGQRCANRHHAAEFRRRRQGGTEP